MPASETLMRMYEDLANRYARQEEPRMRDHCLVLAADAALDVGLSDQAERLRKRLLLTNPHHLLRPYASVAEALQSDDVREYVMDLRRKWSPEVVEQLLREAPSKSETFEAGLAETAPKAREAPEPEVVPVKKPKKEPKPAEAEPLTLEVDDAPESDVGFWIAITLFVLALGAAGAGLVMALGGPLLELSGRAP